MRSRYVDHLDADELADLDRDVCRRYRVARAVRQSHAKTPREDVRRGDYQRPAWRS